MKSRNNKNYLGKLRYDLLCFATIDEVVAVLSDGVDEYGDWNWLTDSTVDDIPLYKAALMRHMSAYMQGERIDPKSSKPHMAHIMCNAMFINELERKFGLIPTNLSLGKLKEKVCK
jgi:hypothetical protein